MRSSNGKYLFTSEAVLEGHPDKVADQISDTVLDEIFKQDNMARVACETFAGMGFILVGGEITTKAYVDVQQIVRDVIRDVGYDKPEYGFDYNTVGVLTSIHGQSPDIAMGVNEDEKKEVGAGDQGMMSGYACKETDVLMPAPHYFAQRLAMKLTEVRKKKELSYLRPDGKTQVTVRYDNGKPDKIVAVVLAAQHDPDVELEQLRADLKEKVIQDVCGDLLADDADFFINNTGRFVIGGPVADVGCTGRKIICDSYGGVGNHGGGCYSGKDCTKVDKTGAYMARYVAKNIVAADLAERCEVQLAYAIGSREPISLFLDTFGTAKTDVNKIYDAVKQVFDFRPGAMIEALDLRRPIYRKTANYGHFGREEPEFTWEKKDKVEELKKAVGL